MVGPVPLGVPSSIADATPPSIALPVSFTVSVALPAIDPLLAVTVYCPAPAGVSIPPDTVPRPGTLVLQATHPVTSIVWPPANVPVAVNVTGDGCCG